VNRAMKVIFLTAACGFFVNGISPADAKGCLKGAVVGGVAGHMAGHGALGAAGGCAVGHHMANKTQQDRYQQPAQHSDDSYTQNRR
jgi:uncharacterized protein YcfJ